MKKLLFIIVSIVLAFSVNAQTIMLQNSNTGVRKSNDQFSGFQATFSYDKIESTTITGTERGTFSSITIEGAFPAGNIGTPQVPVFKKMIAIPVDATPRIVVKNYTTTEYNLENYSIQTLYPVQPPVSKKQNINEIPFAYDEKAYSSSEYNNLPVAEVEILGQMRGLIIGMMVVRPVQYNPAENSIMVYNNIDVEVVFENANLQKTEELYVNTFSPYFKNMYDVVFNRGTRDLFDDHPDLYKTPVRMLVVANEMFQTTLQPWLEWKKKKGFYVEVQYYPNSTPASTIKTFCHNKYNQGASNGTAPTFLVIVGDTPQIPASGLGVAHSSSDADYHRSTDFYYAEVNGGGDYFPEMYYSRMSAQTTQQLENIIEKILYYEKYQFTDPTYLDNVLLIAGADSYGWNSTVAQPTVNYANTYYYNAAHGYANVYKYLNSYTNCYTNLNNVGFANYTAHCNETSWGSPSYELSQISSLTNVNKYFVAMGNCCLAADFGYGECFGEAMIRAQKKGAVGYIGSAPLSWWHNDFHFGVGAYLGNFSSSVPANPTLQNTKEGFYDLSFHDADFNTLCSQVFGGNLSVTYATVTPGYTTDVPILYYWEAYNVLGDGSLMPYNGQAAVNNVSHLSVIYIELPTYEVLAVPGSYVAISKDGVLLGVAVANASGVAVVNITPITSGGNVDIVVTRNQRQPYVQQVPAVAQEGAYIVPAGYTVVGAENLTYISTNQEIEVTLKNVGVAATTGTTNVTISCNDPQIEFNTATATCGTIAPDGTATVKFKVTISNDIVDGKSFAAKLMVTDASKKEWENNISLKAYAPKFSLAKVLVNGTENGNLPKGSLVKITAVVENKGGADAYKVNGDLAISSPYITLACPDMNSVAQNVPIGGSINLDFFVLTSPNMPSGYEANLNLLLSAQYGISASASFKVANAGSNDYCAPGSTNCGSSDKFTSVKLYKTATPTELLINHNPTCASGGYSDHTNIIIPLEPGAHYKLDVSVSTGGQQYIKGWFDLNGDNNFGTNELLVNGSCPSGGSTSFTFTVPQDFVPGESRFRLRCKFNSTMNNACEGYSYGQTLDYTIVLPELYHRVQNVEAALQGSNITVTWKVPAEGTPSGYNVYRNGNKLNGATPLTALTYIEENIEEGIYAYNVTAVYEVNKESFAEMSNVICYILPKLCEVPANLSYTMADNSITITWDEPENIDGVLTSYEIYRDNEKVGETTAEVREYQDTELEDGTYVYQVVALYGHCESDKSEELIIEYVKINELQTSTFKLFPNPTTGHVTFEGKGLNRIEIYDVQGRMLAQYDHVNEKLQINVNQYDNGIYLVKMYSQTHMAVTKRLVIMR